jgi:uncharacterized membrane protein YphA (DoxX/SURF4 family)
MSPQTQTERVEDVSSSWSVASRVAFRFCFVYFGLFCLTTQILGSLIPFDLEIPDASALGPVRQTVFWTAAHIFGAKLPLVYTGSGSGDKTFDWVLAFCLLVVAGVATTVWSLLDRRRENYVPLYKWFRVSVRFALASQMFVYGMVKIVPLQMPFPHLTRLVEPLGHLSPMGVLWFSVGASPAYETFAGSAEMLAGILLAIPRTTLLGALVCMVDIVQIFALNMTYDVPVKLFSFHLMLMALFLLAPDLRRLADFLVLRRDAKAAPEPLLFRTRRANRIALAMQILLAIWLVGMNAYGSRKAWFAYGGGRPKSPLYGIWDVEQLSVDGQLRASSMGGQDRWRRVIFDFTTRTTFQHPDDSFEGFGVSFNVDHRSLALTKDSDKKWKANFTYARPAKDQLILDGDMDGHQIHMQLQLLDREKFLLLSRGFHWVQEYPFNR